MSEEIKCTICEADFRPNVIVELPAGVPKCPLCVEKFPGALTKAEVQVTAKNQAENMTEARVRAIGYEILEEAGLVRHKCEKCHALFFRCKPMQVLCKACGGLKKDEKKETN